MCEDQPFPHFHAVIDAELPSICGALSRKYFQIYFALPPPESTRRLYSTLHLENNDFHVHVPEYYRICIEVNVYTNCFQRAHVRFAWPDNHGRVVRLGKLRGQFHVKIAQEERPNCLDLHISEHLSAASVAAATKSEPAISLTIAARQSQFNTITDAQ